MTLLPNRKGGPEQDGQTVRASKALCPVLPGRRHADGSGRVVCERSKCRVGRHTAHALRNARAARQQQLSQHERSRHHNAAAHERNTLPGEDWLNEVERASGNGCKTRIR